MTDFPPLPGPLPLPEGYHTCPPERQRYVTPEDLPGSTDSITVAEWLKDAPAILNDGPHDLTVTSIVGRGRSWYLHVEDAAGAIAEIALGGPGHSRDKRLRILLGHANIETPEEIREALDGKAIRVRLTTYSFGKGAEFRGIERA